MSACLSAPNKILGTWSPNGSPPREDIESFKKALYNLEESLYVLKVDGKIAVGVGGTALFGSTEGNGHPILAYAPPANPSNLGDASFCSDLGLRYAYISGAMANGIGSVEIAEELGRAGMLGFFGAAGLPPVKVEAAIDRLQSSLGETPYGVNLIHSPNEPAVEAEIADMFIRKGVRLVEASAFLGLTLPIVRYRVHGIFRDADGCVQTPNRVIAKVSRVEVASKFMSPPPESMLNELVALGHITQEQAEMAREIPMAQDTTAEADSGGHTDNRPLVTLLPTLIALRDRLQAQFGFTQTLRVGAAGGIATPVSAAAAYAMGASYLLVGSIHQSCVESGTSDAVRVMLAECGQADTAMAPAADMFEMGVEVQVLKRGTMFAMRAAKLYELYKAHASLEAIPAADMARLEKQTFKAPVSQIWEQTRAFFAERDPAQVTQAEADPKHKMALVFRWYLGQASGWANRGDASRRVDYQVWCGPAMGAFNEWVKGSFYEKPENRRVTHIAQNILLGAAVQARLNILRSQGVVLPADAASVRPVEPRVLEESFK